MSPLLMKKARYKVFYGGRGAAKSRSAADSLIVLSITETHRILCARELQNSISESVHQLLKDRIEALGLNDIFEITNTEIRCLTTGSTFIFKGLRTNSAEVKSMEGITICWVEEARAISGASLDDVIPTIRTPGSEIWFTFNTGTVEDPVYKRFVTTDRDDAIIVKINYYDNPWFGETALVPDMEHDKLHNPERYRHVWLGEPGASGSFFPEFSSEMEEDPFILDNHAYLYGSLDHGTTAPTSFGLWWKDHNKVPHRLFTYYESDRVTSDHAIGIATQLQSFKWCQGRPPHLVLCDPSMWTKTKHQTGYQPAAIDFYELTFKQLFKNAGYTTKFVPANNDIRNGCDVMREYLKINNGVPSMRYWDRYNKPWVKEMREIPTDPKDSEKYDTTKPDHSVDDSRYGIVGMMGSSQQSVEKMDNKRYTKGGNVLKNKYAQVMRDIA